MVPTAEEAAASKATGADAGRPGHHKNIEISRVLRKMTRARTLAPEIAAREETTKSTRTSSCRGSSPQDYGTVRGLCGGCKASEMITMINTEVARDEKTGALRINGAFSIILLRYATKMEEAVR